VDDALDLFAEHAMGGIVGLLANGLFATTDVIALDGVSSSIQGGWLDHNWKQLYKQFAYVVAVSAYAFVVTAALAFAIDKIPGLGLRASAEDEALGMDDAQIGEFANDYVEVRREFTDWTPAPSGGPKDVERWDSDERPSAHVQPAGGGGAATGDRHGVPDTGAHSYEMGGVGGHRDKPRDADKPGRREGSSATHVDGNANGNAGGHVAAGGRHGRPDFGPEQYDGNAEKRV
jgi:Amt family ammonium transporter